MRNEFRAKPRAVEALVFIYWLLAGRSVTSVTGKTIRDSLLRRQLPRTRVSRTRWRGQDDGNEFAVETQRRLGLFSPTITLNDIGVYSTVEYDCASLRGEDPPLPPPFRETRPPQHHFAGLLCLVEPPCLRKYNSGSINSLSIRIDE